MLVRLQGHEAMRRSLGENRDKHRIDMLLLDQLYRIFAEFFH